MFKSLLENWGKKAIVSIVGIVVSAAIAIINAKFGLNLETPEVLAPVAGTIAYTIMQAIVDAVTRGVTSSLKGTPVAPDPAVPVWNPTSVKSGMSPPAPHNPEG
jgi:hypothetical protein